jgi:Tfp pilus assembly protein PilX
MNSPIRIRAAAASLAVMLTLMLVAGLDRLAAAHHANASAQIASEAIDATRG